MEYIDVVVISCSWLRVFFLLVLCQFINGWSGQGGDVYLVEVNRNSINNNVQIRTGMKRKSEDSKFTTCVLRRFGHLVRMDDKRLWNRVMKAELR